MTVSKQKRRAKIKKRIRGLIHGDSTFPRLTVFRSNKEIYCQVIDDNDGKTLISVSSRDKKILDLKLKNNLEKSFNVGKVIAEKALKLGITRVKFDRGGYLYHGRVKSLADGAREGGLKL